MSDLQSLIQLLIQKHGFANVQAEVKNAAMKRPRAGRKKKNQPEAMGLLIYVAVEQLRGKQSASAACDRLKKALKLDCDLLSKYNAGKKMSRSRADGTLADEPVHSVGLFSRLGGKPSSKIFEDILKSACKSR